ncbi:MAG: S9 family peptidase [Clostridia bacterium]
MTEANQKRIPTVEDYFEFKCPGDPRVSPDGSRVVYCVLERDLEADETRSNLYLADLDGSSPRRLTTAKAKDTAPRWSPDGERIAFLSDRDGKNHVWVINADGGEAAKLTCDVNPSGPAIWSPDGKRLAFTARAFLPEEDWTTYAGAPEGDRERALARARGEEDADDIKVITRARYRFDGQGYFGDRREHIHVVDADPESEEKTRAITSGSFDNFGPPTWSPDGRWLVFPSLRRDDADIRVAMDLWAHELETGREVHLLEGMGVINNPVYSPRGDRIVFAGHDGRDGPSSIVGLWAISPDLDSEDPLAVVDAVHLTEKLDRPVGVGGIASDLRCAPTGAPVVWDNSGESLLFLAADGGAAYVYRSQLDGEVEKVAGRDDAVISAFDWVPGVLVVQMGDGSKPEEVMLHDARGDGFVPISRANETLLEKLHIQKLETFDYTGEDGLSLEGFLLRAPDAREDSPAPTVLQVHGGPHGAYGHTFSFLSQLMATNGFNVVMTNPRGSGTYGTEFATAVVEDWGGADMGDILAGLDVVSGMGIVDEERIGVGGWSYGGFMSSWLLGRSDRFAAGVVGAPVAERFAFYGTSDIGLTFGEHQCGAKPWEGADALLERSPIINADQITAPVLLLHGEADLRCPVAQSEQLFAALKRLEREVAMVVYPGESHGVRGPVHVRDRYLRTLKWYQHYLV